MRFISHFICAGTLLCSVAASAAEPPVRPFKAIYESQFDVGFSLSGEVVRSLTATDNGQWLFQNRISAMVASINEQSQLRFDNQQAIPQHYYYKKKVLGKKRESVMSLNWTDGMADGKKGDTEWSLKIPTGTQDKLSYQLQMRLDLKAGKTGPLHYTLADNGRLKTYRFNVVGEESVTSPLGTYPAIKVEMDRGENADRETYIWFAPALDYMIIKLAQTEPDGKAYALQLKSVETYP